MDTDANYAEKADDRRSMSGVAVAAGNSTVRCSINTQKIVTLSTTEAEYVALGDGVKEGMFVKAVLSFIVPSLSVKSVKLLVDNEGGVNLEANPLSSARTKRIDVRFHFIRELVRIRTIAVEHIPTKKQRADILTKALIGTIFREHRNFSVEFV